MGLKQMLNEQEPVEKQESLSTEMTDLIQALNLEISKLQSEKQEMLLTLKKQDEKLKEQNNYVEQSKKNELENKRLLKEAQEAKAGADKALRNAQFEKKKAEDAMQVMYKAKSEKNTALEIARKSERDLNSSKMTYKSLFIGQMIFTFALAFFVAYSKRGVLQEMGSWFPARWGNIKSFTSWIAMKYMAATHLIQGKWDIGNWAFVIVTIIALIILVIFLFIAMVLLTKSYEVIEELRSNVFDTTFKDIVSGDIVLISLYITLFFVDPIKRIIPFNNLSVWLILSFTGIVLWYIGEIRETFK